ncbi:MAG: DeoR family transcriptional regulator [Bacteroidetes bacterium]|jgi:predicted DNA-binding transcriptional regulator YafY|nr:DeoR family transcriptional regulator [Bacteroidota bacterium]
MSEKETNKISRITAILLQLQTKRIITATFLAEKFEVSVRTIYRDIRTLEQAGVPVTTEDGKGYSLMVGYKIPPVMFSERQANALILAEQLVLKNKDASLIKDYSEAIEKIKAVLKQPDRDRANLLSERTTFGKLAKFERTSSILSELQHALTNFYLVKFKYANAQNDKTHRTVEPFALINTLESWLLVAYCHLRKDFRFFRLDRMTDTDVLNQRFKAHKMTLQEFFVKYHGHQ